jgi:hypothetical protein
VADTKITGYAALTALAIDDLFVVVDVSDATMAATGTDKKITTANILKWTETEIDFGTTPQWAMTFTVTDANCTSSALHVAVVQSSNTATGRTAGDVEWDQLLLAALPGTGSFVVTAMAFPGPVVGKRKIQYQIAA